MMEKLCAVCHKNHTHKYRVLKNEGKGKPIQRKPNIWRLEI